MSICIIYGAASSEASSDADSADDNSEDDDDEGNYDRQQRLSQIQVRIQTQLRRHCVDPAQSTWAEHASSWSRQNIYLESFDSFRSQLRLIAICQSPYALQRGQLHLFFGKSHRTFTCCVMFIILMIHCDNCLRLDAARLGSGVAGDFNLEPSGAA